MHEDKMREQVLRHKEEMMDKMIDYLKAAQVAAKELGATAIYINLGYSDSIGVQFYEEDFPFDKEKSKRKESYDANREQLCEDVCGVEFYCYVDKAKKEETNDEGHHDEAAADSDGIESAEESVQQIR